MAKEQPKKNKDKKPKFSAYWIYAAIILVFLGDQLFQWKRVQEPAKTNPAEFLTFS